MSDRPPPPYGSHAIYPLLSTCAGTAFVACVLLIGTRIQPDIARAIIDTAASAMIAGVVVFVTVRVR